ncbi:hypothetical protein Scep_025967 [Stephania cephalantha]|uniref:Uncharacterized protein n=1 Tax=Stephania cephalantha TaxID=152367 RepID=A0AAP0HMS5_9MAGN
MARGKSILSRQEVDGEPARAQRRAETATTTSPSTSANRGKRRAQTASYRKDKQQATQVSDLRARPSSGDDVEAEASNVPMGSKSSCGGDGRSNGGLRSAAQQRALPGSCIIYSKFGQQRPN